MRVNEIAVAEYKRLCPVSWHKCKGDDERLLYKIIRAVKLGKQIYTYDNGCKVIRYQCVNFMLDEDEKEIMVIWKDKGKGYVTVRESTKNLYDDIFLHDKYSVADLKKVMEVIN